jgi:oxygen-independent coproporphyrinogen-3 oxidase
VVAVIPIVPAGQDAAAPRDLQQSMRPGTLQLASLPPLSLYVHLPWCIRK